MRGLIVLNIVVGVAGCATPGWRGQGTQQQFAQDRYECLAKSQTYYGRDNALFNACMGVHGWTWQ